MNVVERIVIGDDCWEWAGSHDKQGYSRTGRALAHREVYKLLVGPIPEGTELDHLCRNRGCVRPKHLEPVDHRTNVLRGQGLAAQQARRTHCPQGHPYDEENTYLSPKGKRDCKTCRRAGDRRRRPPKGRR